MLSFAKQVCRVTTSAMAAVPLSLSVSCPIGVMLGSHYLSRGRLFTIAHGSVHRPLVRPHRRGKAPTLTEAKSALHEAETKLEKAETKLETAKAELDKAKAELEKAKAELNEVKNCGDINAIRRAEQNCDAAQAGVSTAQEGVSTAQEGVSTAQRLVTKLTNELPAGREHLPAGDAISLPHTGK